MRSAGRVGIALGTVAVIAAFGCGHKSHSIVGVWDIKGGPGTATFTFKADGNFATEATMPGQHSTTTGQYTVDGDTVTFKTMQQRTATLQWKSNDEATMTGDDGVAKTIVRQK